MNKKNPPSSFLFVGLDFMVNKTGKLFFLEINSSPGLIMRYGKLYGECTPIVNLDKSLKKYKQDYILIYSKNFYSKAVEAINYKAELLRKLSKRECHICTYTWDEIKNFKDNFLLDIEGKKITKGIIFTPLNDIKNAFIANRNYTIINNPDIKHLTLDKHVCNQIVGRVSGLNVPKTYEFKTKAELEKIIKTKKILPAVIKPRYGTKGAGVRFINHLQDLKGIKLLDDAYIVQEKIEVNKDGDCYWDMRTFVCNRKYSGSIKRFSKNPVVNVSQGGDTTKIDHKFDSLLKTVSESYLKKIEAYFKKNTFRFKVLTIVSSIPKGKVLTYKKVAKLAHRPQAYRAVSSILSQNYDPQIPCHRVVCSNGHIGGYNRGVNNKLKLLKEEGIIIGKDGKIQYTFPNN